MATRQSPPMPQLGETIPDGAVEFFPDGNYGAALLADDGSRRIVQGAFFQVNEYQMPFHITHISNFYGWYFWEWNDELRRLDFN